MAFLFFIDFYKYVYIILVSRCLLSAIKCNYIVNMHDLYVLPWALIILTLKLSWPVGLIIIVLVGYKVDILPQVPGAFVSVRVNNSISSL